MALITGARRLRRKQEAAYSARPIEQEHEPGDWIFEYVPGILIPVLFLTYLVVGTLAHMVLPPKLASRLFKL
jgi:hypothetical protein